MSRRTELTEEQQEILRTIRDFVDRDVLPNVSRYDHADEFPEPLVQTMRELGLFGTTIPEEYGGLGLDLTTYALIVKELSRGWISLSGVVNTHFMASFMLKTFGTDEQKDRLLPRMARGEIRAAFSMTEPHAGSDVQAIRTRAVRDGDEYVINGQKMWVTNGLRAGIVMLLTVTDPTAQPRHAGMTAFIVEKEPGVAEQPGLTIPPPLKKLGYKGVESTELVFDGYRIPASSILGGDDRGRRRLQAVHGRHRARPRERRRPRAGDRRVGARERGPLCPRARGVRQADRQPSADPGEDRHDGHEDPGRRAADARRRAV